MQLDNIELHLYLPRDVESAIPDALFPYIHGSGDNSSDSEDQIVICRPSTQAQYAVSLIDSLRTLTGCDSSPIVLVDRYQNIYKVEFYHASK